MSIVWIAPGFAVSPQLQVDQLSEIAAAGYCGIVNNRPDEEGPDQPSSAALEAEALRLGLDYAYIPVAPGEAGEEEARALDRFLQRVEGPVLAFCRTGNRSSQLWNLARGSG